MKIKRFFSFPTFPLAAAFLSLSATVPLMAELPTSPLDGEFTTSSNEYIYADWWWKLEIGPSGVWNIVGDLAQVNWGYEDYNNKILTGSGTLNIGSDTVAGALYIMGQNPPSSDNYWDRILDFNGTVNVGKMGSFSFGGTYHSRWGMISYIDTLNVNGGMVSVMSETQNDSYFGIKNLTVRDGGMLESAALCLTTADGGEWNLHSGGRVVSSLLRVQSGTFTLNLLGENALSGLPKLSFDNNIATDFRINVSANNSIETLELNSNATLGLSVADGATLNIENLTSKSNVQSLTDVTFVFYDYSADSVLFGASDIWVEDNRLYIPSINTFVDLIAYDGEGNLLQGEWFYDWNGETGRLVLNAVPEPAAVAAVLGALALAFAARRKRK